MIAGLLAFGASWWKAAVGFLVAAPLFFILGQCEGRNTQRRIDDAARAEANVQAQKTNLVASEQAAAERVQDAATVTVKEEALIDAIQETPDTAPDAARVALGCARLREQGENIALIPACG